jgi:hypothetical protein
VDAGVHVLVVAGIGDGQYESAGGFVGWQMCG